MALHRPGSLLTVTLAGQVTVGAVFTVPLTATFCVVAPVEVQAILPAGVPVAVAAILT